MLSKTVKVLKQKVQKKEKKTENIKDLLEKQLVVNEQINLLNHKFGGVAQEMLNNQMENPDSEDTNMDIIS